MLPLVNNFYVPGRPLALSLQARHPSVSTRLGQRCGHYVPTMPLEPGNLGLSDLASPSVPIDLGHAASSGNANVQVP